MLSDCFSSHPILKNKKRMGFFSPLIFLCLSVLYPSTPLSSKSSPFLHCFARQHTHTYRHTQTHTHRFDTLEVAPGGENKADKVNRTCGEREGGGVGGPGMEYGGYRNGILAFCLEYEVDSDSDNDTRAVLMLWRKQTGTLHPSLLAVTWKGFYIWLGAFFLYFYIRNWLAFNLGLLFFKMCLLKGGPARSFISPCEKVFLQQKVCSHVAQH